MGLVKRHPDWPKKRTIALKTIWDDKPDTPMQSYLVVDGAGGGSQFQPATFVADWPDADGDWPTGEGD